MKNNKIIIIPTYNEAKNISTLLKEILSLYSDIDLVVVDDNSPDKTGEIVEEFALKDKRVKCLHREKKEGIGPAYIAGFKYATTRDYEYIVQMDADFSHDPRYIEPLINLAKDYDCVIGSRYVKGGGTENWGRLRKMISKLGSFYARTVSGVLINDFTSGLKCFRKNAVEQIEFETIASKGYAFNIETVIRLHKNKARIKELPITFRERSSGKSKMSLAIILEAITKVWGFKYYLR